MGGLGHKLELGSWKYWVLGVEYPDMLILASMILSTYIWITNNLNGKIMSHSDPYEFGLKYIHFRRLCCDADDHQILCSVCEDQPRLTKLSAQKTLLLKQIEGQKYCLLAVAKKHRKQSYIHGACLLQQKYIESKATYIIHGKL